MNEPTDSNSSAAASAFASAASCAERTVDSSAAYVRENPLPAILGALAIGLVAGLLVGHREPTRRERYLNEPIDELKDLIGTLRSRVTHGAQEGYEGASSVVDRTLKTLRKTFHLA